MLPALWGPLLGRHRCGLACMLLPHASSCPLGCRQALAPAPAPPSCPLSSLPLLLLRRQRAADLDAALKGHNTGYEVQLSNK